MLPLCTFTASPLRQAAVITKTTGQIIYTSVLLIHRQLVIPSYASCTEMYSLFYVSINLVLYAAVSAGLI